MRAPREEDSRLAYRMVIEPTRNGWIGSVYDDSDIVVANCASCDRDEVITALWNLWEDAVADHYEEAHHAWWQELSPEERRALDAADADDFSRN